MCLQVTIGGLEHALTPLAAANPLIHVFDHPTLYKDALWLPYRRAHADIADAVHTAVKTASTARRPTSLTAVFAHADVVGASLNSHFQVGATMVVVALWACAMTLRAHAMASTHLLTLLHAHPGMHCCVLLLHAACTTVHQDTPRYTTIHQDTPRYTKIHHNTPKYTKIHTVVTQFPSRRVLACSQTSFQQTCLCGLAITTSHTPFLAPAFATSAHHTRYAWSHLYCQLQQCARPLENLQPPKLPIHKIPNPPNSPGLSSRRRPGQAAACFASQCGDGQCSSSVAPGGRGAVGPGSPSFFGWCQRGSGGTSGHCYRGKSGRPSAVDAPG